MSLFKTKEWWKTVCGGDETFDGRSLLVAPFFGAEKKDVVFVGSHSGYLRIYKPTSQWQEESRAPTDYKLTDLLIEAKVCECIVDLKLGRFVSGTQNVHLAVLSPTKLTVHRVILVDGPSEQGDRCDLKIAYEHQLPRFPASLTVGPFGGARGRDFLCVQCLDGTLLFYEQEVHAFKLVLGNRLLPEPIVYVSRNDVFVTSSSSWVLECYRYQGMAEFGRSQDASGRTPVPDWSYNIGEAVLEIDAVTLSSFEVAILVLAERSLYCMKDNCVGLRYAKRLDYKPRCFRAYVIEPDGKLMVLVIADTNTLMIYEGTALKWSAQLSFAPVALARAHLQHLQGAIVVLSAEGMLEACYMGSEPGLFVAPPLHRRGYDYPAAEQELQELRARLKKSKNDPTVETSDVELIVTLVVSPELLTSPGENSTAKDGTHEFACAVTCELSSYTRLSDVQLCLDVCKPLVASQSYHAVANLCDRRVLQTQVYIDGEAAPISSEVRVTVSYKGERGQLRVLRKSAQLPLKMMLRSCPPESACSFAATIKCNEPPLPFTQLFPEFTTADTTANPSGALGLRHVRSGHVVTIVSGSTSNRYRVQSNDPASMTLVVQQLTTRMKDRQRAGSASISQSQIQLVHSRIEAHFLSRLEIDRITSELRLLTTQLRNIERRMLRAVRERSARSLTDTGLPFLLESTYTAIFQLLDDLATAKLARERAAHELRCAVRLLLVLLGLNGNDKYPIFEAAVGFEAQLRDDVGWEEIAEVGLSAFLKWTSRKSGSSDAKPLSSWSRVTTTKDLSKLKKRMVHAIERLDSCRESDLESEQVVAPAESSLGSSGRS